MAYNPFNIFRRNQKAIFAVITVFIIFTFVLSSGLGGGADFFDWLPRWLGTKSKKGDVLCTMDGSKIYESELSQVNFKRVMANRFMSLATAHARAWLDATVTEQMRNLSPQAQQTLTQVDSTERFVLAEMGRNPQLAAQLPFFVQQWQLSVRAILSNPTAKAEDKDAARYKLASLAMFQNQAMGGSEHYFGNAPNRNRRDQINFLLWQKKADQLGIKFTTNDVMKLIEKEFYNAFRGDAQVRVTRELQQHLGGFTINKCIDAIGEEFRVRAAQVAVLGPAGHGGRPDKTYGG